MSLTKLLNLENKMAKLFKQAATEVPTTVAACDDLLNIIEGKLSPENLTGDGERSASSVRRDRIMLNDAEKEVRAIREQLASQKTTFTMSDLPAGTEIIDGPALTNDEVRDLAVRLGKRPKVGIKDAIRARVAQHALSSISLAYFVSEGFSAATVRTAVSDLKNPKYCGKAGVLVLVLGA